MRRALFLPLLLLLATAAAWRPDDAYMLHVGKTDVIKMDVTNRTVREVVALRRRFGDEPFLWTRLAGREYLIRDKALLQQAAELWSPIEAMKPEQHMLGDEIRELDHRIDAIEDHRATGKPGELQQLRERYETLSRRERELDRRTDEMEKVVEPKLRDLVDEAIRDGRARELR